MNKALVLMLIVILGIPAVASAQRIFQVVRVSTDDSAGHLTWPEESPPVVLVTLLRCGILTPRLISLPGWKPVGQQTADCSTWQISPR